MTDNEALKIAKKQLSQAIHLSECGVNDGIRAMYEDKSEWLCSLISCIERQKAEIEKLKSENLVLSQNRITMPERLEIVNNARAEAIRAFVANVKIAINERFSDEIQDSNAHLYLMNTLLDDLVKEMTEESNDQQKT